MVVKGWNEEQCNECIITQHTCTEEQKRKGTYQVLRLTTCTAIWVAVSGDCDCFRMAIICCKPSGWGSHVILIRVFYLKSQENCENVANNCFDFDCQKLVMKMAFTFQFKIHGVFGVFLCHDCNSPLNKFIKNIYLIKLFFFCVRMFYFSSFLMWKQLVPSLWTKGWKSSRK